jgi:hypothetical protein
VYVDGEPDTFNCTCACFRNIGWSLAMPLAFESASHGTIAFGFFNIDSDMLLLERYFLFSTEFSKRVSALAAEPVGRPFLDFWRGYHIPGAEAVGDLMNAIHGVEFTGFIGEVYKLFPFPSDPRLFRQKPEGTGTRRKIESLISRFADAVQIPFRVDEAGLEVAIGPYVFSKEVFREIVAYVWRGGFPRWRDDSPPPFILEMKKRVEASGHPLFEAISVECL